MDKERITMLSLLTLLEREGVGVGAIKDGDGKEEYHSERAQLRHRTISVDVGRLLQSEFQHALISLAMLGGVDSGIAGLRPWIASCRIWL